MTGLHVSRLDREMRVKIASARYDEDEIEQIRGVLQRTIDTRKRASRRVLVLFAAIDALMTASTLFAGPGLPADVVLLCLGWVLSVELVAWAVVWVLQVAILRWDFNRAAECGYPQLVNCRLH